MVSGIHQYIHSHSRSTFEVPTLFMKYDNTITYFHFSIFYLSNTMTSDQLSAQGPGHQQSLYQVGSATRNICLYIISQSHVQPIPPTRYAVNTGWQGRDFHGCHLPVKINFAPFAAWKNNRRLWRHNNSISHSREITCQLWWCHNAQSEKTAIGEDGPLARYAKLLVSHAPGMPRTFSPPPTTKETVR